jgi:hypothetical protein
MCARQPIAKLGIFEMATQAGTIGVSRRTVRERDDLRNVSATVHMQATRTMTLLALNALLGMKSSPEIFGDVGVTSRARVRAHRSCPRNLHVLRKRGDGVFGFLGCVGWDAEDYD